MELVKNKPNKFDTLRPETESRLNLFLNRKYTYGFVVELYEDFIKLLDEDEEINSLAKLFRKVELPTSYFKKFNRMYKEEPYVGVLAERILDILEDRLIDGALINKANATMTNNVLQNKFNWAEKQENKNIEVKPVEIIEIVTPEE